MKKILLLSIVSIAILFVSLAINTNVKKTTGTIDLKVALQSANAVTAWVHDSPSTFSVWGMSNLRSNDPIWYNMKFGYQPIGLSYTFVYGWENLSNLAYPCCLWCGENNGGEPCTTNATITTYSTTTTYDSETGQTSTTYTSRTRTTKIFGRNLVN